MSRNSALEKENTALSKALDDAMERAFNAEHALQDFIESEDSRVEDGSRLDFLERILQKATFTGRCRIETYRKGKGLMLEETNSTPSFGTIREAIDDLM